MFAPVDNAFHELTVSYVFYAFCTSLFYFRV